MKWFARWLVIPSIILLATAIVVANPTRLPDQHVVNDWKTNDPELQAEREVLDQKQTELAQRIAYKDALITELLESRMTLMQVSEEFLRLNREIPTALFVIRAKYPNRPDDEVSALNVLDFVEDRISREPQKQGMLCTLQEQFVKRFGHAFSPGGHH